MRKPQLHTLFLSLLGLLISVASGSGQPAWVQGQEEGEKGIKSEEVLKRPKAAPKAAAPPVAAAKPRTPPKPAALAPPPTPVKPKATYSANKKRPAVPLTPGTEYVRVGLTLFRYEPPGSKYRETGEGARDIIQEGTEEAPKPPRNQQDWTPADWMRADVHTQFAVGQVVRLRLEPLTPAGYLYIIAQEQYADGSSGPAHLLFPTLKTNGGNNYMQPNQPFWLPRAPAFFRLTPSPSAARKHVGELLTLVLRAEPPERLLPQPLGDKAMPLTANDVAKLTQGSSGDFVTMTLDGGAGQRQTDQEARKDITQEGEEAPLNEDDPPPQTVYEARRKPGQPVLFRISLRFKPQ